MHSEFYTSDARSNRVLDVHLSYSCSIAGGRAKYCSLMVDVTRAHTKSNANETVIETRLYGDNKATSAVEGDVIVIAKRRLGLGLGLVQ